MATPCTFCGGELEMTGFEQVFGHPQSRRWRYACRHCGAVHELDAAGTVLSAEPAADHSWRHAPAEHGGSGAAQGATGSADSL